MVQFPVPSIQAAAAKFATLRRARLARAGPKSRPLMKVNTAMDATGDPIWCGRSKVFMKRGSNYDVVVTGVLTI